MNRPDNYRFPNVASHSDSQRLQQLESELSEKSVMFDSLEVENKRLERQNRELNERIRVLEAMLNSRPPDTVNNNADPQLILEQFFEFMKKSTPGFVSSLKTTSPNAVDSKSSHAFNRNANINGDKYGHGNQQYNGGGNDSYNSASSNRKQVAPPVKHIPDFKLPLPAAYIAAFYIIESSKPCLDTIFYLKVKKGDVLSLQEFPVAINRSMVVDVVVYLYSKNRNIKFISDEMSLRIFKDSIKIPPLPKPLNSNRDVSNLSSSTKTPQKEDSNIATSHVYEHDKQEVSSQVMDMKMPSSLSNPLKSTSSSTNQNAVPIHNPFIPSEQPKVSIWKFELQKVLDDLNGIIDDSKKESLIEKFEVVFAGRLIKPLKDDSPDPASIKARVEMCFDLILKIIHDEDIDLREHLSNSKTLEDCRREKGPVESDVISTEVCVQSSIGSSGDHVNMQDEELEASIAGNPVNTQDEDCSNSDFKVKVEDKNDRSSDNEVNKVNDDDLKTNGRFDAVEEREDSNVFDRVNTKDERDDNNTIANLRDERGSSNDIGQVDVNDESNVSSVVENEKRDRFNSVEQSNIRDDICYSYNNTSSNYDNDQVHVERADSNTNNEDRADSSTNTQVESHEELDSSYVVISLTKELDNSKTELKANYEDNDQVNIREDERDDSNTNNHVHSLDEGGSDSDNKANIEDDRVDSIVNEKVNDELNTIDRANTQDEGLVTSTLSECDDSSSSKTSQPATNPWKFEIQQALDDYKDIIKESNRDDFVVKLEAIFDNRLVTPLNQDSPDPALIIDRIQICLDDILELVMTAEL